MTSSGQRAKRTLLGLGAGPGTPGRAAQQLTFFALFYLYLLLGVKPHLIYYGAGTITNFPSFYTTGRFFASHLSCPGGLADYAGAFLSQLFYYSWLGALVVTAQAWGFYLCVGALTTAFGLKRLRLLGYVPALLLLILYSRYTYYLPTTLALLLALACACVYLTAARHGRPALGWTAYAVLSLATYYVAGGAFLFFALICILDTLRVTRRWPVAALYTAIAAALPYIVGVLAFNVSVINAYTELLPVSWELLYFPPRHRWIGLVYTLYLLVPALLIAGGLGTFLWTRRRPQAKPPAHRGKHARHPHRLTAALSRYRAAPRLQWTVQTLVLVGIGAAAAAASLDRPLKIRLDVEYYAYHKMWPEVLREGRKNHGSAFVMHAVNQALYHTGRLGEEMFTWTQEPAYLFLTGIDRKWVQWQTFDVHLEMGLINLAEHALMDCLESMGEQPMILKRLALISMVNGNIGTARIYLNALRQTLFHRDWAGRQLERLEQDPNLTTHEDVQRLRSLAMEQDFPTVRLPEERMLLSLLEKNGQNRMAFEYLMAWYLLNKQLDRFVAHFQDFGTMGYNIWPRHFDEALVTYSLVTRTSALLRQHKPRKEVLDQMEHFAGILNRHGGDTRAALPDLAKYHSNTYAFYNLYARSEKTP